MSDLYTEQLLKLLNMKEDFNMIYGGRVSGLSYKLKIKEEIKMKFEKGDFVKIKNMEGGKFDKIKESDVCKIINFDLSYYNVTIENKWGFKGHTTLDNLEALEKFEIGEKVKVINEHDGNKKIVNKIGKIININNFNQDLDIDFEEDIDGWVTERNKWNVPFSKVIKYEDLIKVGDTVRINKKATIEDFTKNYWNHCKLDTLEFIEKEGDSDEIFVVKNKIDNDCVSLKKKKSDYGYYVFYENVNINILEKIEEDVKEMTIEEISKELGYKIKIKEEEE